MTLIDLTWLDICPKVYFQYIFLMTADDKYSLLNRDNLTQPIRTPLSQKQKAFSEFFVPFSSLNFEHSQKKDNPHG